MSQNVEPASGAPEPPPDADARAQRLYEAQQGPILGFFFRRLGRELAEDATQDVFLKMLQALRRGIVTSDADVPYLWRIAHNRLSDHWRKKEVPIADGSLPDLEPSRERGPLDVAMEADVRCALQRLPVKERDACWLRHGREQKMEDVAAALGVTTTWVYQLLSRGESKLRQFLGGTRSMEAPREVGAECPRGGDA